MISKASSAVAAGLIHSVEPKTNGSIVGWGDNSFGELDVPQPNENFVGISAGNYQSLGLKADGSIVAWGVNRNIDYGQANLPEPNAGFVANSAGKYLNLGLLAFTHDVSIVGAESLHMHAQIELGIDPVCVAMGLRPFRHRDRRRLRFDQAAVRSDCAGMPGLILNGKN